MKALLENTQFVETLGILFYCIVALLVVWIILKLYGVTSSPLVRANKNIIEIQKILAKLQEMLKNRKKIDIDRVAAMLRTLNRYNRKLIKNLAAFQYDNYNMVEIVKAKDEIVRINNECIKIIDNLDDGDDTNNNEIEFVIMGMDKIMDQASKSIKIARLRESHKKMVE